jgi:hypothetical protein
VFYEYIAVSLFLRADISKQGAEAYFTSQSQASQTQRK